jgi:hypothetical protein
MMYLFAVAVVTIYQPERAVQELEGLSREEIIAIARQSEDGGQPPNRVMEQGSGVPSDAILLLGEDLSTYWEAIDGTEASWSLTDGVLTVEPGSGDIRTRQKFGDVQLHAEWMIPIDPDDIRTGQAPGNSGIFFQERYEVQILESFANVTYRNGQAAAIYKQNPPLVNASTPRGTWQTYDIIFRAPKFSESGDLASPARMTVLHNGVVVHDNAALTGETAFLRSPSYNPHGPESLRLQDHGEPISFRNIWIRPLD